MYIQICEHMFISTQVLCICAKYKPGELHFVSAKFSHSLRLMIILEGRSQMPIEVNNLVLQNRIRCKMADFFP